MSMKVADGCFKEYHVDNKCSVKEFTEANGLKFAKGKVFYKLVKKENVQNYKNVIVKRRSDGSCITGELVKSLLKIEKKNKVLNVSLDSTDYPDFDIFIQSTSHNRKLDAGSSMLFQLKDLETVVDEPAVKADKRPVPEEVEDGDAKKAKKAKTTGGKVDVVFSFDTTGSMYACLAEVRRGVKEAIQRLKAEVRDIRIAIIAHGDYCDAHGSYVTKMVGFTEDETQLCNFVQTVGATGGGDADECYELVLKEARTKLKWRPGSTRSLVMIGDCNPHGPNYPLNTQKIDWRTECELLKEEEIRVYAVQALNRKEATKFYRELATKTDGFHLHLDQFSSIVNFMMAICFKEEGGDTLDNYEAEVVRGSKKLNRELHRLFATLQGREITSGVGGGERSDGLVPIDPSRFQVLHVETRCSIKEFVLENSLIFKTGRGFYEFTKPEIISHKKEVVLVDRATGDMFTGHEAAEMIGAGGAGRVKPAVLDSWRVFVQSTSYNRALVPHTGFLYEVDPDR